MIVTPMDLLRAYPNRRKQAFLDAVRSYTEGLGYRARTEKGRWGCRNLVIGDPETARYLITSRFSNASGVVTLLETAASMPHNLRSRVCFVLFGGGAGMSAYHQKHRCACGLQTVLHLDRVGDGGWILFVPNEALKADGDGLDRMIGLERRCGEKRVQIRDSGSPARMIFPKGARICARRGKLPNFRDGSPDYTNVNILRACLITLVGGAAE